MNDYWKFGTAYNLIDLTEKQNHYNSPSLSFQSGPSHFVTLVLHEGLKLLSNQYLHTI